MKTILATLLVLVMVNISLADEHIDKAIKLSYTVAGVNNSGSSVLVTRKRGKDNIHFLWTAAHVVGDNQCFRKGLVGIFNQYEILYTDLNVMQELIQDGRKVGMIMYHAQIVRLGSAQFGQDLALLQLRAKNLTDESTLFSRDLPQIGQKIFHVGSIHGMRGVNTYSEGNVAAIGRIRRQRDLYDQASIIATSGSSGCGVYLPTGKCLGLIIEQQVPHVVFYKPTRIIREWAEKHDCLWAIDDNVPLPPDQEILSKRDKYIADLPNEVVLSLRELLAPLGLTSGK